MLRGGGFGNNDDNVRCAARNDNDPTNRNDNVGFRVVLSTLFAAGTARRAAPARVGLPGRGKKWRSLFPAAPELRAPAGHITTAPPPGLALGRGTIQRVFEQLTSWNNLLSAFRKAARGKRRVPAVAAFEHRLEDHLLELQAALRSKTYRPRSYTSFRVHEPKERLISAAAFHDRVVHHALCNVIEPVFERRFIADSYACRRGKGTHRALDRCQSFARRYPYFLQCDLRQFFPSIDHAVLRGNLACRLDDADVMWLVDRILASGEGVLTEAYDMVYFPGDDLLAVLRSRGLPIGNLTSQFWANVYLDSFDQFVKRELRCKGYLRYVDDLLLFGSDKKPLWAWKRAIVDRLATLRMTIHPRAHPRPVTEGIPFLGFVVYPDRRRLKRRKGIHYRRRLAAKVRQFKEGALERGALDDSIRGWVNHVGYANNVGLRKAVLRSSRYVDVFRKHAEHPPCSPKP